MHSVCAIETGRVTVLDRTGSGELLAIEWSCSSCEHEFWLAVEDKPKFRDFVPKACPFCTDRFDEWKQLAR